MGQLIDGKWTREDVLTDSSGKYVRKETSFRDRIDSSGSFPPEKGRYHLYISYACPWACRAVMLRALKNLDKVVSMSHVNVVVKKDGWSFKEDQEVSKDPLYDFDFLHQLYTLSNPDYTGRVSVPVLWDKKEKKIINNESAEILRMLNSEFNDFTDIKTDFYPKALQKKIDEMNEFVLTHINNGVYKCGFAKTQEAYESSVKALFKALNRLENLLSEKQYLVGEVFTEADVRLFTSLVRFDPVYVGHFKCNLKRLVDYPALQQYMLKIIKKPNVRETIKLDYIKGHYYQSHLHINPTGIVPLGPKVSI